MRCIPFGFWCVGTIAAGLSLAAPRVLGESSERLLKRIKETDNALTQSFEALLHEIETENVVAPTQAELSRELRVTSAAGAWGAHARLTSQKPAYAARVPNEEYDASKRLLQWLQQEEVYYEDSGTSAIIRIFRSQYVSPDNRTEQGQAVGTHVDLYPPSTSGDRSYRHTVYPLWAAGRGFGEFLDSAIEARPQGQSVLLIAEGHFRRIQGTWNITLQSEDTLLVRRAELVTDRQSKIIIETSGSTVFGGVALASSGSVSLMPARLQYELRDWKLQGNLDLLEDLRKRVNGPYPPHTQVFDYRLGNKPLIYQTEGPATMPACDIDQVTKAITASSPSTTPSPGGAESLQYDIDRKQPSAVVPPVHGCPARKTFATSRRLLLYAAVVLVGVVSLIFVGRRFWF